MAHPEIDNRTPFAVEMNFPTDEEGRPLAVPIVKATYDVDTRGGLALAPDQTPVDFLGESYGEPGVSSFRLEPDIAFVKPATDVVLLGHAHAPRSNTSVVDVTFQAGKLGKTVRVWGDRWVTGGMMADLSPPQPFERIPLTWERAFGGWDRTPGDEELHWFDVRNPVGVGYVSKHGKVMEGSPLPNLEDPWDPLRAPGGHCKPAGFGFVSPDWQARAQYAGTYDDRWMASRAPLLPTDFNRRFFNSGSEGMTAAGYFLGDEWIQVQGATQEGNWIFQLPRLENPRCLISTRFNGDRELATSLDTVIVDADEKRLILTWRAHGPVRDGPLDVKTLVVECANAPSVENNTHGSSGPGSSGAA